MIVKRKKYLGEIQYKSRTHHNNRAKSAKEISMSKIKAKDALAALALLAVFIAIMLGNVLTPDVFG